MSKPECRESRVVPFDPAGAVWAAAAVAAGVVGSQNDDTRPDARDVDDMGRLLPSPPKTPFQRQLPPGSVVMGAGVWQTVGTVGTVATARPPLAPVAPVVGNVRASELEAVKRVLCGEIRALELQKARLAQHVQTQNRVIRGFCDLETQRRDGRLG